MFLNSEIRAPDCKTFTVIVKKIPIMSVHFLNAHSTVHLFCEILEVNFHRLGYTDY